MIPSNAPPIAALITSGLSLCLSNSAGASPVQIASSTTEVAAGEAGIFSRFVSLETVDCWEPIMTWVANQDPGGWLVLDLMDCLVRVLEPIWDEDLLTDMLARESFVISPDTLHSLSCQLNLKAPLAWSNPQLPQFLHGQESRGNQINVLTACKPHVASLRKDRLDQLGFSLDSPDYFHSCKRGQKGEALFLLLERRCSMLGKPPPWVLLVDNSSANLSAMASVLDTHAIRYRSFLYTGATRPKPTLDDLNRMRKILRSGLYQAPPSL